MIKMATKMDSKWKDFGQYRNTPLLPEMGGG